MHVLRTGELLLAMGQRHPRSGTATKAAPDGWDAQGAFCRDARPAHEPELAQRTGKAPGARAR